MQAECSGQHQANLIAESFTYNKGLDFSESLALVGEQAILKTLLAWVIADDVELH